MNTLTEVLNEKKRVKSLIIKQYKLPKTTRAVILNRLQNAEISDFLARACEEIGVFFTQDIEEALLDGVDICVSDDITVSQSKTHLLAKGIVPVFPEKSEYTLEEFNPMKFSGNAFLFAEARPFLIFEKICRALENANYAGDRRMLVKNLLETLTPA